MKNKDGTEKIVVGVLKSKHPEGVEPEEGVLEDHPKLPDTVTMDINENTVTKVAETNLLRSS